MRFIAVVLSLLQLGAYLDITCLNNFPLIESDSSFMSNDLPNALKTVIAFKILHAEYTQWYTFQSMQVCC